MLSLLNTEWARTPHASIPLLLSGQILAQIRKIRNRALRVDDTEAVNLCQRTQASIHELANLIREAYAVRVTVDYNPDIPIVVASNGRFQLSLVPVTTAHDWPTRAEILGGTIVRAWKISSD